MDDFIKQLSESISRDTAQRCSANLKFAPSNSRLSNSLSLSLSLGCSSVKFYFQLLSTHKYFTLGASTAPLPDALSKIDISAAESSRVFRRERPRAMASIARINLSRASKCTSALFRDPFGLLDISLKYPTLLTRESATRIAERKLRGDSKFLRLSFLGTFPIYRYTCHYTVPDMSPLDYREIRRTVRITRRRRRGTRTIRRSFVLLSSSVEKSLSRAREYLFASQPRGRKIGRVVDGRGRARSI